MPNHNKLIDEQIQYYKDRANEYDEWFLRQGRYDRGPDFKKQWFQEVSEVKQALHSVKPNGSVLELACGTGLWTEYLLPFAKQLTAVDTSQEMIDLNNKRLTPAKIKYHLANIFDWKSEEAFDFIFFSFWLSHVPPEKFNAFWNSIRSYLNPSGRVFFIDSIYEPASSAVDHPYPEQSQTTAKRRLNDDREYEIIKIFYDPLELQNKLYDLGWSLKIKKTKNYFLYGTGKMK